MNPKLNFVKLYIDIYELTECIAVMRVVFVLSVDIAHRTAATRSSGALASTSHT